jgi:HSP20 family molecular chaperone IbpA
MAKIWGDFRWRVVNRLFMLAFFIAPKGSAKAAYENGIYEVSRQIVETFERARSNG